MAEWKEQLIETDVDRLMEYLQEEGSVSLREAASALGVEHKTVLAWSRSLEKAGFLDITYSATKGKMLRLHEDHALVDEQLEAVKDEAAKKLQETQKWNKEQARLRRFEDALLRLERMLHRDEDDVDVLRKQFSDADESLNELDAYEDDLETAEDELEELREHLDDIKQDFEVIARMQQHRNQEKQPGIVDRIKQQIPFIGSSNGEEEENTDDADDEGLETETFKCEQCEKAFETEHGLNTHVGRVHKED